MSVSAAMATGLMATRIKTDLEFQLQSLSQRKLALLDKSREVSLFLSGGFGEVNPYQQAQASMQLFIIQATEKELDTKMKDLDTKLKSYTQIEESWLKASKENAKQSFTAFA